MTDHQRSPANVLACSYAAATAALLINFPFDTIKTRLQTSNDSLGYSVSHLYKEQGIRGFYRGVSASLISSSAARAMSMSLYTSFVPMYANFFGISMPNPSSRPLVPVFFAGATAGAFSCILTGPFEFTKTASQVESLIMRNRTSAAASLGGGAAGSAAGSAAGAAAGPVKTGALQAVQNLRRRGGWATLYGGVEYHCMRDSLGSAIYFSVYEALKQGLSRNQMPGDKPNPIAVAVGGAACGIASWLAVYPIDTMKSEYQRDLYSKTMIQSSLEYNDTVVRRPKFKFSLKMYRGLGFSLLRTSFNGICLFSFFEYFLYISRPR